MLIQSKNEKTLMTGTSEVLVCYSEHATNPSESPIVYQHPVSTNPSTTSNDYYTKLVFQ